jgi:thiol:disulfide interchange protein DsbD
MVPIVSGIIVGQGRDVTGRQGFLLSLTYVLGMASTYTFAGIAVAAGGQHVQAAFQQPWIVMLFAALFVLLAFSMFGFFTVQMPAAIQTRVAALSNRQAAGTLGGVFVMGALSALIVTTCVAPALVGALIVIGQSGNILRGGIALFVMGLGMGTPLLVVGASAGKLLPKAGPWMTMVKQLFGALMLAVAAWMLSRILADRFVLVLWALPAFAAAVVLWRGAGALRAGSVPIRLAAAATGLYTVLLVTGAALGGTDPLSPLPQLSASRHELAFRTIKSVTDLDREVAAAHSAGRPVMLDFYADWCVSCKEMAKYTFSDAKVQSALDRAVLLRADVTRNDEEDQALLKRFGIFGPPTIAFYGADGEERRNFRVVGYMKAPDFASLAQLALTASATTARVGSP